MPKTKFTQFITQLTKNLLLNILFYKFSCTLSVMYVHIRPLVKLVEQCMT